MSDDPGAGPAGAPARWALSAGHVDQLSVWIAAESESAGISPEHAAGSSRTSSPPTDGRCAEGSRSATRRGRRPKPAGAVKFKGKIGFRVKLVAAAPLDVFTSAFTLEFATGVDGSVEADRKAKVEGFIEGTAAMEMTAGGFKGRQIGMTIPVYKTPLWERALPPALAYATADAVEIRTGQASPDRIGPIPARTAAHQLLWSPDGTRLAWTTRPTTPGGPGSHVYLADLATGKVGDWECPDCRISFAGNQLLSEWSSLDGEEKGLARYRVGSPEPGEAPLGNPGILHSGQTEDERLEVAKRYCGSGGCATIGLYGESGKSGQPLVGIPWNDCRVRLFRVDSRLRAAPFTVATPNRDSVTEPGPDGRLLVAGWNIDDGCDDEPPDAAVVRTVRGRSAGQRAGSLPVRLLGGMPPLLRQEEDPARRPRPAYGRRRCPHAGVPLLPAARRGLPDAESARRLLGGDP